MMRSISKSQILVLLLLSICTSFKATAQSKYSVFKSQPGFMVSPTYSMVFPGGDLEERYGRFSGIGLNLEFKTVSNWYVGGWYQWNFGNRVKETGIFDTLIGSEGQIIDEEGQFAIYRLSQRGHQFGIKTGYIIPILKRNKNSGIVIEVGGGYLTHKIDIYSSVKVPQLADEYLPGYDRLTGGYMTRQFIGFQYLDPNKRVNFRIGYEATQAFTQSLRPYNFDTRMKDEKQRTDLMNGFQVSLILPLYTHNKQEEIIFD